jgi:C4-dicarboxylate transporter DctQ subunit
MRDALERLDNLLEKIEGFVLVVTFSLLIVLMTINILQRNVFGQSSQMLQEYMPNLVVWISLIGATIGMKHGKHIRMEISLKFLPAAYQKALHRVGGVFGFLIMALGFYISLSFFANELKLFGAIGWASAIIPVFFLIVAFRYALQVLTPKE